MKLGKTEFVQQFATRFMGNESAYTHLASLSGGDSNSVKITRVVALGRDIWEEIERMDQLDHADKL